MALQGTAHGTLPQPSSGNGTPSQTQTAAPMFDTVMVPPASESAGSLPAAASCCSSASSWLTCSTDLRCTWRRSGAGGPAAGVRGEGTDVGGRDEGGGATLEGAEAVGNAMGRAVCVAGWGWPARMCHIHVEIGRYLPPIASCTEPLSPPSPPPKKHPTQCPSSLLPPDLLDVGHHQAQRRGHCDADVVAAVQQQLLAAGAQAGVEVRVAAERHRQRLDQEGQAGQLVVLEGGGVGRGQGATGDGGRAGGGGRSGMGDGGWGSTSQGRG